MHHYTKRFLFGRTLSYLWVIGPILSGKYTWLTPHGWGPQALPTQLWETSDASPRENFVWIFPILASTKEHIVSEHNPDGDIMIAILEFFAYISQIYPFPPLMAPFNIIQTKIYYTANQIWVWRGSVILANTSGLYYVKPLRYVGEQALIIILGMLTLLITTK